MTRQAFGRRAMVAALAAALLPLSPVPSPTTASALTDAARMPESSPLTAFGVPARLVVFLPFTVYVDHPFDIVVWIADDGEQLVKEGTSATINMAVDPASGADAGLTCPGGPSAPSITAGPNAGLALFEDCEVQEAGDFTLRASASNVVSTVVPAPVIAPHQAVLHVLPSIEAPQDAMSLTVDGGEDPFVVLPWGRSFTLRVRFTPNGGNQPIRIQESLRTTSSWRTVADLVTDAAGTATLVVRPGVSAWYRVVFEGSPALAAGRSNVFTALVNAVARQRPVHRTPRVIRAGSTVRFETTVQPVIDGLAPTKVGFELYHRVAGRWRLADLRTRSVDATGVAKINITFGSRGEWYVRSYAKRQLAPNPAIDPERYLAALGPSAPSSIARFTVQ